MRLPLALVGLLISALCVKPAHADPNWGAGTYTQTCNETFPGPTLNKSVWAKINHPTPSPFFGDGDVSVAIPQNVQMVPGGGVEIIAKHQNFPVTPTFGTNYTSGFLNGAGGGLGCGYQQYGWFEAKFQMPSIAGGANGLWPAFWFLPATSPVGAFELDVMERFTSASGVGFTNQYATSTLHYNGYNNSAYLCTMQNTQGWADTMHTFAVDWEASSLQIYIDGTLCNTSAMASPNNNNPTGTYTGSGIPNVPMFVLFDNIIDWVSNLAQEEALPSPFTIQYYKVWQKNSTTQTVLPLVASPTMTDKSSYNPGDTATFTMTITTGNSTESGVHFGGFVFDLCGDNGSSNKACSQTNNNFGSQVLSSSSSMAANASQVFTATYAVPSTMQPGVYVAELSATDTAGDSYAAHCHLIVGNPQP